MLDLFEQHKSSYDPNHIRDIVDAYLQTFLHQENTFTYKVLFIARLNNLGIKSCCWLQNYEDFFVDLFVAGTETSASTLRWGILCLMLHQEVQERMYQEIDKVIGKLQFELAF